MNNDPHIYNAAQWLLSYASKRRKKTLGISIDEMGSLRVYRMERSLPGCAEFQTSYEDDVSCTCITARSNLVYGPSTNYRIRHLVPSENFRLMGVPEPYIDSIIAQISSDAKLTSISGNSIVVDVLEHIFRKLFIDTDPPGNQLNLF